MTIERIKAPDLGGADDVEVIEICVKVGDEIAAEDSLVVLESDKASMEVPSPMAGKVSKILLKEGDSLSEGGDILELEVADGATAEPAHEVQEESTQVESDAAETVNSAPAEQSEPTKAVASVQVIHVPDLGGADDVEVIEICVSVGDEVAENDSLLVLESDKASMEIPAPFGGKIVSLALKEGDKVSVGQVLGEIEGHGAAAQEAADTSVVDPAPAPAQEAQTTPNTIEAVEEQRRAQKVSERISDSRPSESVYAGPAVRKLARELGVDLAQVSGSAPKGRIVKEDVQAYVKNLVQRKAGGAAASVATSGAGIPAIPEVDFSKFGDVDIQAMSKLHKITSANMHRSWLNVPHVTQFDEADITDLESFRKGMKAEAERKGVKLTPLPFLLKAAAAALLAEPKFNASISHDGESIVYKKYVHIGIAVDTPAGLVVPVLRDVDKKNLWQLAAESAELAQKAKDRKLKPADMQGGCFTISSLGGIGGTGFTPIVNAPEVAILGVSKLAVKPVWNGRDFEPRSMLPLSLSYDHRAVNGADAGRFFTYMAAALADIRRLLL